MLEDKVRVPLTSAILAPFAAQVEAISVSVDLIAGRSTQQPIVSTVDGVQSRTYDIVCLDWPSDDMYDKDKITDFCLQLRRVLVAYSRAFRYVFILSPNMPQWAKVKPTLAAWAFEAHTCVESIIANLLGNIGRPAFVYQAVIVLWCFSPNMAGHLGLFSRQVTHGRIWDHSFQYSPGRQQERSRCRFSEGPYQKQSCWKTSRIQRTLHAGSLLHNNKCKTATLKKRTARASRNSPRMLYVFLCGRRLPETALLTPSEFEDFGVAWPLV